MELLNLSFLTPSQIRKVTQRMLQLVEELDRSHPDLRESETYQIRAQQKPIASAILLDCTGRLVHSLMLRRLVPHQQDSRP